MIIKVSIQAQVIKLTLLLIFIGCSKMVLAQPAICTDPAIMTPSCAAACIICDIDGFTGINNGGSVGEAPSDFCTKEVHNARWIAFMAGSVDLKIQFSVSNCQTRRGLELAIYEGIDCQNFRMISNCLGSENAVGDGESAVFQNTEPLVIGQYYYIVMDGSQADVCNWSFTVLEGSTKVNPLTVSSPIEGEFDVCTNYSGWYYTPKITGAIDYNWTLDGTYIGSGDSIFLTWDTEGDFSLCVAASNVCDVADEVCQLIEVREIEPTYIDSAICAGDVFRMSDGSEFAVAGEYNVVFKTQQGCDSTVSLTLDILPNSSATFEYNVCEGDSFPWIDQFYTEAGIYNSVVLANNGCDSSIGLVLNVIDCDLELNTTVVNPSCFGKSDGKLNFGVVNGLPPFSYEWTSISSGENGDGTLSTLDELVHLIDLSNGWYYIYVQDSLKNAVAVQIKVNEPDSLISVISNLDYGGYGISCFGLSDGQLTINSIGGTQPYNYLWENGDTIATRSGLPSGKYTVSTIDSAGCFTNDSMELLQPDSLIAQFQFVNPDCDNPESGMVNVEDVFGGVNPYEYKLNNQDSKSTPHFSGLGADTYIASVIDLNGCFTDSIGTLVAPEKAIIEAYNDADIFLGDSIFLDVTSSITLNEENVFWSPANTVLCDTCASTVAVPTHTDHYVVTVTSKDGCLSKDSVLVLVTPRGRVYVPSAFTPNKDGLNETFYVLGGPEILEIASFQIYNRWGEKLYDQERIPPHQPSLGWDGTYQGTDVPQGVYVWVATIEYIDNRKFVYRGTVTLAR